ncbi:MAG: hypothetical protein ACTSYD_00560 [Candidatus Heimdallarchaeaceae archaeon]
MEDSQKQQLLNIIHQLSYYLIDQARKKSGKDILDIEINDIVYSKAQGRFGEVFICDVFYRSEVGEHKTKLAIKFFGDESTVTNEIKNTIHLEQKFSTRSLIELPKYIYANLNSPMYVVYEGITGINYEDATEILDKSFWAGYVLAIIHGINPRPVIYEVYEELFRRLVLAVFGGSAEEEIIMSESNMFFTMIKESSGGCDAFGDYHQSNLMLRTTPQGEILKIALIDPTFWMPGSFDRFEDMGTFFGRQAFVEFREKKNIINTIGDIKQFLQGYNVYLREVDIPVLTELYPKGFPLDFFLGIWSMMDYIDKTTIQHIPSDNVNMQLLKEFAVYVLTKKPIYSALWKK